MGIAPVIVAGDAVIVGDIIVPSGGAFGIPDTRMSTADPGHLCCIATGTCAGKRLT
jgi:hypothetical protein